MADQYAEFLDRDVYDCKEFTSILIHRQQGIADYTSVQCHLDIDGQDGVGFKYGTMNAHAGTIVSYVLQTVDRRGLL